jgi:hypothetical protein
MTFVLVLAAKYPVMVTGGGQGGTKPMQSGWRGHSWGPLPVLAGGAIPTIGPANEGYNHPKKPL